MKDFHQPMSRRVQKLNFLLSRNLSLTFWLSGWGTGGGVIFMSLLSYTFQSILNSFVFGYFFGGEQLIIFMDGGYSPPPLHRKFLNFSLIDHFIQVLGLIAQVD